MQQVVRSRKMNRSDGSVGGIDFETSEQLCEIHRNLRNSTKERLQSILNATPLLCDFNGDVTYDDIAAEISIVKGDAIKIYVTREPYQRLKLIVSRTNTIIELKSAIKRSFNALQNRLKLKNAKDKSSSKRSNKHNEPIVNISWKYIWRTYYLRHNGAALINNEKTLAEYDIRNKAILDFVKKIKIDRKNQRKR